MGGLPEALRRRRKELGLTLSQIADQMGVTEATVQRWESGNIKTIRHEKIARLAEVLDVNPATLMGWDDSTSSWSDETKKGRKEFYKIMMDIMDEKNLDIPDFARACNLSDREVRSIIIRHSKTAPLDVALKISAAFDIPLEYLNGDTLKPTPEKPVVNKTDSDEFHLLDLYRQMNPEGQARVIEYADDLVQSGKYKKFSGARPLAACGYTGEPIEIDKLSGLESEAIALEEGNLEL